MNSPHSEDAKLAERVAREVRKSPAKAALLGGCVLLAAWVWVPRIHAGLTREPIEPSLGAPAIESETQPTGSNLPTRDSLAIRSEFIAISNEARALRRFVDPVPAPPSARDPFVGPPRPEPPPEPAPVSTAPEPDPLGDETIALQSLHLDGVLLFGRGARAVIDGRVVVVGDVVAGFRVESISARAVRLRGTMGTHTLTMDKPGAADGQAPTRKTEAPASPASPASPQSPPSNLDRELKSVEQENEP